MVVALVESKRSRRSTIALRVFTSSPKSPCGSRSKNAKRHCPPLATIARRAALS